MDHAWTSNWPWLVMALLALTVPVAYWLGSKKRNKADSATLTAGRWALSRARDLGDVKDASDGDLSRALDKWLAGATQPIAASPEQQNVELLADLELAKEFQLAYLDRPYPKIPETHFEGRLRLDFYHRYEPALALGGDFFDLIPLAPDTAGVFVADVMGHGARSALITTILRTLLRDLKGQGRNAKHYITEVNKQLCDILKMFPQPLFASAYYFVPDTTSRMATFTTAGHPAPFHIKRSVGRIRRLETPSPHGAALGIIKGEEYLAGHERLIAGDAFIFFTDGVYEAMNAEGEEFGLGRMEKVLREYMYKSVQTIVDELMRAVLDFVGEAPVHDDICVVAVDVTTSAESHADHDKDTSA